LEVTIVGNTAMHHFLMGLDPRYLSRAPYPPVLTDGQDLKARDLGLGIGPGGYVHLLPLKAGFVGSDAIACILATGIHRSGTCSLLIDLGTNGEIVLADGKRLVCCSAAAGPAFEGGHITWGMRAAEGAIERIKIDPETRRVGVKTINDKPPLGICGSGIISAGAEMVRSGIILSRGNFNEDVRHPLLREGDEGLEFVLVPASNAVPGRDITITARDVSQIQMAKSAIYAGAGLLMELAGGEKIRRVLLAGACGNSLDPLDALTIDLLPKSEKARVMAVGNAAGYGASLALLDRFKRNEAERVAGRARYQELAAADRFQELFVKGMFFTSATDHEDEF
jgi:uncharacterized 2Fe-2S/4Fe-4S cluster protein (DUF4445 family)